MPSMPSWSGFARLQRRSGRARSRLPSSTGRCQVEQDEQEHRRPAASARTCARSARRSGTPLRKPRNSGGSPSGVSEPPMLATRKMKKTTTWTLCWRHALARSSGRISSIDAPVVPIQLAITVPTARSAVLTERRARASWPANWMPPATVNSASSRMMNGMYSSSISVEDLEQRQLASRTRPGTAPAKPAPRRREILPK